MARPEINTINAEAFPDHTPLAGILQNDTQIVHYKAGDIVVREGDYGNSAFLILDGKLRVFVGDYPDYLLGRDTAGKKGLFATISQIWTSSKIPETRDTEKYGSQAVRSGDSRDARSRTRSSPSRVFVQDVPAILDECRTAEMGEGELFGELAALGRIPRTATIFAESDATLLEVRWQGLREIRRFDEGFRRAIDRRYRQNALLVHLRETELFSSLDEDALGKVADATLFETYGAFDWHVSFQRLRSSGLGGTEHEPAIARQGEYADGLLMIRAGFGRVAIDYGSGQRTITYLGAGHAFGLEELYTAWQSGVSVSFGASLTALGYVDVLRVPAPVLEEYVFPEISSPPVENVDPGKRTLTEDALLEWAVDERFINATKSMLIDLNRCVRCDDCVRACASTHGGDPRFIRHGKTFDHWMVANACMHCADPVCMIGCPTGAIHRSQVSGTVVINDETCIGCVTCASSCPYNNIRMVEIRSRSGDALVDPDSSRPILKATKCDLCYTNPGGPACVRACPHDALRRVDFQQGKLVEGDL
jgi:Fe-S-cluster-containing dehydrogenase component/CRP-like cAMP-binding protein